MPAFEFALCLISVEIKQTGNLLRQMFCICTFCGQFTAATWSEGSIIKLLFWKEDVCHFDKCYNKN